MEPNKTKQNMMNLQIYSTDFILRTETSAYTQHKKYLPRQLHKDFE